MDNATYDVLNRSQGNSNETYSTLATISTKINNNHETQKNEDINKQSYSNRAPNNKILLVAIIIMMVILMIITIASLALSVAAYNQPKAEQSTVLSQPNAADSDIPAQLAATCNNLSQMLLQVDTKINDLTALILQNTDMEPQSNCGPGLWYQVAHLNMSDPSQRCPPVWREYNTSGIRACGRPTTSTGSCATKYYLTSHQYSRVCGRVIGYQVASPDAFAKLRDEQIDFDGVNITSGAKREHIWSYVAGLNEIQPMSDTKFKCPCSTTNGRDPPSSIGENYYCESGNPTDTFQDNQIFSTDPLWDGQQCEGTCCMRTGTNSPPWFSVQLPAPTTDRIQVSICADEPTNNEDTPIKLLEIYVQ
jgi:hypothetical protein